MSDVLAPLSRRANQRRDQPHFVYSLWGNCECIYVGSTSQLGRRLATHATKDWWPDVRRVESEWYPDKYTALAAEKDLIEERGPLVNKLGAF